MHPQGIVIQIGKQDSVLTQCDHRMGLHRKVAHTTLYATLLIILGIFKRGVRIIQDHTNNKFIEYTARMVRYNYCTVSSNHIKSSSGVLLKTQNTPSDQYIKKLANLYGLMAARYPKKKKGISVIVKTYNEQKYIRRCLRSLIAQLKGIPHEIIVVDSLSTDKTVEYARKYCTRICQIIHPSQRSCSIGPAIGWWESRYDTLLLIDGDMWLAPGFIRKAQSMLTADSSLAGVAGVVIHKRVDNALSRRDQARQYSQAGQYLNHLDGGGLYRSSCIEQIGYFANPHLNAYEEADLGMRITERSYRLYRMDAPGFYHTPHQGYSFNVLIKKFRSGYLHGSGQLIRYNWSIRWLPHLCRMFALYISVWAVWTMALIGIIVGYTTSVLIIGVSAMMLYTIIKRDIRQAAVSLVSWNVTAIGMGIGLLRPVKPINRIQHYRIL